MVSSRASTRGNGNGRRPLASAIRSYRSPVRRPLLPLPPTPFARMPTLFAHTKIYLCEAHSILLNDGVSILHKPSPIEPRRPSKRISPPTPTSPVIPFLSIPILQSHPITTRIQKKKKKINKEADESIHQKTIQGWKKHGPPSVPGAASITVPLPTPGDDHHPDPHLPGGARAPPGGRREGGREAQVSFAEGTGGARPRRPRGPSGRERGKCGSG